MSNSDSMTEVVVEEASNQLDAEGLIGGDSLQEQVDSAEVGRAVGARLGETTGRRLGAAIGRRVQETLADIDEAAGPRDVASDLLGAVRDGFEDALSESRDAGSALSSIADSVQETDLGSEVAGALGAEGDEATSADAETEESATEAADAESDTETDESSSLADVPSPADAVDEMDAEELDVDDLESFQTETLEEYLQTIPYRDLQSIAKEVGVTANITQEEMTERIVDAVTDDS